MLATKTRPKRSVLTIHRYATSLRPLRPFARVIRFKKPQAQFLIKRLREICDREGLEADLRVLTQLAEMTSGDVRSCLNTLQVSGDEIIHNMCIRFDLPKVHQVEIANRDV